MVYNLPGVQELTLTSEAIMGIYSGNYTHWNHSHLQQHNSHHSLPWQRIHPVARVDDVTDTGVLTQYLTSAEGDWADRHGVFTAQRWDDQVVKLHGRREYGVADIVKATEYSLGYTSLQVAQRMGLPMAKVINQAGFAVSANVRSVQSAVKGQVLAVTADDLQVLATNPPGAASYPLISCSFMVIHPHDMSDCSSAAELANYIDWIVTHEEEDTMALGLIPLGSAVQKKIINEVVKVMTCHGHIVYHGAKLEDSSGQKVDTSWKIPVGVLVPILLVFIALTSGYLIYQRIKYNRILEREDWNIKITDMTFFIPTKTVKCSTNNCSVSSRKELSIGGGAGNLPKIVTSLHGKWENYNVTICPFLIKELNLQDKETKKIVMELKESLVNENLSRFYGFTFVDNERYFVREYCSKGSLSTVLKEDRYSMTVGLKCALALEIANGMCYLHDHGIVHANLTSNCCLVDSRWMVKISDWEYTNLYLALIRQERWQKGVVPNCRTFFADQSTWSKDQDEIARAQAKFWRAPEILKDSTITPTSTHDVYSFGIIMNELFTQAKPYDENLSTLTPQEVLDAVVLSYLRPKHAEDTPVKARQIIEIAWADDPDSRPTFSQILRMLKSTVSSTKTTLDHIMEAIEEYSQELEEKLEEAAHDIVGQHEEMEAILSQSVPLPLLEGIKTGSPEKPNSFTSASLLLLQIQPDSALMSGSPAQATHFLTAFEELVQQLMAGKSAYKLEHSAYGMLIISGAPVQTVVKHVGIVATLALDIMMATKLLWNNLFSCKAKSNPEKTNNNNNGKVLHVSQEVPLVGAIHTGAVSGGLVQRPDSRLQWYAVYGRTVEEARTLVKYSKPYMVLVSDSSRVILETIGGFYLTPAHVCEINGKEAGSVSTYWLNGRAGSLLTSHIGAKKPDLTQNLQEDLTSVITEVNC